MYFDRSIVIVNNVISLICVYLCFFHSEGVQNQIYSMNKLYTISSAVLFKITLKKYIYYTTIPNRLFQHEIFRT